MYCQPSCVSANIFTLAVQGMNSKIFCFTVRYKIDMITNVHIRITSRIFPLYTGRSVLCPAASLGLTLSWLGLPIEGVVSFGAEPLHDDGILGCDTFLWFVDRVNFNFALSLPSVKRIVLVWKSDVVFTSFLVILLTKCRFWSVEVVVARGGGVGASDKSISFLVDIIG